VTQDGFTTGRLIGIDINETGHFQWAAQILREGY